jgi:CRP-like cAMP-binding protein
MIRIPHAKADPKLAELRELPIFAGLPLRQLRRMVLNLDEVTVPEGERILRAGRANDAAWIVLEGEAELTVGGNVREVLKRGDVFGLPSMFTRRDSMADVVARTPLRALVASHQQFNSMISDPELEIRFKAAMFDRLRDEVYQLTHKGNQARAAKARTVKPKKKA